MTVGAFFGRGLIKQHWLAFDHAGQLVAAFAAHVLVHSLQRESGSLVMVEQGWPPLRTVVAFRTGRDLAPGELLAMDVLVALLTSGRRRFEVNVEEASLLIGRFVTVHASRGPMGAEQGERSLRVIEV